MSQVAAAKLFQIHMLDETPYGGWSVRDGDTEQRTLISSRQLGRVIAITRDEALRYGWRMARDFESKFGIAPLDVICYQVAQEMN